VFATWRRERREVGWARGEIEPQTHRFSPINDGRNSNVSRTPTVSNWANNVQRVTV
jgi:hypothetical protein